ncbi:MULTISPECIES: helix-turn-helix transcriptional regulator [unclassified Bacillus cereus group]|uniref:ArsR/SmtB family transcription factor n=1 Tax=unclassified Bacillus cereus group TaxID=2750818 RepID=UPI001F5741ED|nr:MULTISPECIES: winged helix-turn-helix domain-containing protein [unclassified Bacillus cereus group]
MHLSQIASLISTPSRAKMLIHLLDGRIYPASELAYEAKIKPQTASHHLSKMIEGGILHMEKHGRHRYYKIANAEVAQVLETLLSISLPEKTSSFKQACQSEALKHARTCYDHLAGKLGVSVTNSLINQGYLIKDGLNFDVTDTGRHFFTHFDIDVDEVRQRRRLFARACLDWSERQHHLGGALGFSLTSYFLNNNWVQRTPSCRSLIITDTGKKNIEKIFKISID